MAPLELAQLYFKLTEFSRAWEILTPLSEQAICLGQWNLFWSVEPLRLRILAEQMRFGEIAKLVARLNQLSDQNGLYQRAEYFHTLGICDAYSGRVESSELKFRQALALAEAQSSATLRSQALAGLSLCQCHQGLPELALQTIGQATQLMLSAVVAQSELAIQLKLTEALVLRDLRRFEQAFASLEAAQVLVQAQSHWYMKINIIYIAATIYEKMGALERAEFHFDFARTMVNEKQLTQMSRQIDARLRELRQNPDEPADMVFAKKPALAVRERTKGSIEFRNQLVLYELLSVLVESPGRVFSKEELVGRIWSEEYNPAQHDNKLYVTMRRLRKLIEVDGKRPKYILRSRWGYYFNSDVRVIQEPK